MLFHSCRCLLTIVATLLNAACVRSAEPKNSSVTAPPAFSGQDVSDLFEASAAGDLRRVTQVVESKGSGIVNFQVDPTRATPLLRAVEFKRLDVAKYLLSHGANVDPEDAKKGTPLMHAAFLGDTAMVELLLKAGADPNKQETRYGDTPLTFAAWKGHEQAVRLLLDAGANPATRTVNGETPRQLAERRRFEGIVRLLDAASRPKSP